MLSTIAPPDAAPRTLVRESLSGRYRAREVAVGGLAVVVSATLHVWAALGASAPIWADDEIGVLANARVLAGVGAPWHLANLSYYPGWSVVLAPIWWFTQDPTTVYRLAIAVSVLAAVAAILPLAAVARSLGARPHVAVVLASVVTLAPARTVLSNYVVIENFLVLMVALAAWAAIRFADWPTVPRAVTFAVASAYVFFSHGRMVPVVVAACLWFATYLWRSRARVALVGIVVTVVGTVAGYAVNAWLAAQLYGASGRRETAAFSRMFDGTPQSIARSFIGQSWYATVAWSGLALLGASALVLTVAREVRRREPGAASWFATAFVGLATISVLFISRPIAGGSARLDLAAYGRYLDPFLVVFALVGLVLVVRQITRRSSVALLVAISTVGLVFVALIAPRTPAGGWWATMNSAGLLSLPWPAPGDTASPPWVALSLVAVAFGLCFVLLRRHPWVTVALLSIWFVAGSVVADRTSVAAFNEVYDDTPALLPAIEALGDHEVSFDRLRSDGRGQNLYQFWLADREVEVFRGDEALPPTEIVISRPDAFEPAALGGVILEESRSNAVWIMPGDLQDELVEQGILTDD